MKKHTREKGSVLLVVLFIVICVTFLSMGFLSRSDTELYCGDNMLLRTQMDYLCQGGLSYCRALILTDAYVLPTTLPPTPLYGGASSPDVFTAQISAGVPSPADPNFTYSIEVDAYREIDGEKVGLTSVQGQLHRNKSTGRAFFKSIKRQ